MKDDETPWQLNLVGFVVAALFAAFFVAGLMGSIAVLITAGQ